MKEIFIPIPGFEKHYSVSNMGRVRRDMSGQGAIKGKILKKSITNRGYIRINLHKNGKNKPVFVHNLVALTFIGIKPVGFDTNHKDGIKTNNIPSNLEYITHYDNIKHSNINGLVKHPSGENHPRSKLTENQVIRIINYFTSKKYINQNTKLNILSKKYKISTSQIYSIITRKSWLSIKNI